MKTVSGRIFKINQTISINTVKQNAVKSTAQIVIGQLNCDEKNYDCIASGDGSATVSVWDCVTLKECKEIVTIGSHWTELFEEILTRPEEVKLAGGKAAKTKWIEQIEVLQNKLSKPSYSVSTVEFEFIKAVHAWTCNR